MSARLPTGLLFALAIGALLRCPRLADRPLHNDEAVNAIKFGQLWDHHLARTYGPYHYDPNEHHGPALPYLSFALAYASGAPGINQFSEARLRALDVLFGLGLILLLTIVASGLGRSATFFASLLFAVSPALVFYSRDYIHEMLFVFFGFLALAAGWRYFQTRRIGWALLTGLAIGLMQATKETFVLNLAAASVALGMNLAWRRWLDAAQPPSKSARVNRLHAFGALAVWAGVAVVLFSGFFTYPEGVLDSLRTYKPWLGRAGGLSPHLHSYGFYLHRLVWFQSGTGPVCTEAFIVCLAVLAAGAGFARKLPANIDPVLVRFLSFYTLALTAAYSLIAYKTPWCLLSFWLGIVLLAGIGAAVFLHRLRRRSAKLVGLCLLLAGASHLAWQAWRAGGPFSSDPANPYVYAQTLPDTLDLVNQIRALARVHPPNRPFSVQVMGLDGDYWPLPWYLRDLAAGFWSSVPTGPYAPVLVVSAGFHAALDEAQTHQMPRYYQLRPGDFLELYVDRGLWQAYLLTQPARSAQ